MAAEIRCEDPVCLHCGLDVPTGPRLFAEINGQTFPVCCIGCRAAVQMLDRSGLGDWYVRREGPSGHAAILPAEMLETIAHVETEAFEAEFVDYGEQDSAEVDLLVDDLRCAACVWVIEQHLGNLGGVESVRVSLASHRVHVVWNHQVLRLRDLLERLAEIGFAARPNRPGAEAVRDRRENRAALIRLGIAGLGAMNVMTYAIALYLGGFEGMSEGAEALMRWMGWLVSTPVVLVAARPFFVGAWRDFSRKRPGMDVPVALAIGGAYAASAFATVRGTGEVYFDSVCMFTFFLTLGRYLEQRVQSRSASFVREMVESMPALGRRLDPDEPIECAEETVVPARQLRVSDRIRVLPGEAIPADGVIVFGASAVDEALLSGEPWPRTVEVGEAVAAGSQNIDQTLILEATRVGSDTQLASILSLVDRAASERAPIERMADRVAGYFVTGVLTIAGVNGVVWMGIEPERALWTTLSVLVATCPCALGLATPLAISAASQGLARAGFLVTHARAFSALTRIHRLLFDKTGTLTEGTPSLAKVELSSERTRAEVLALASALESESVHPIARAFRPGPSGSLKPNAEHPIAFSALADFDRPLLEKMRDRRNVAGAGVEARLGGHLYRLGRPDWAAPDSGGWERAPERVTERATEGGRERLTWIWLSEEGRTLARFGLVDSLRPEAEQTLSDLRDQGFALEMLSGDPSPGAAALAQKLDLDMVCPAASPEAKWARVRSLQEEGENVALVGDGVNDSPSLRAADLSVAMGGGCDLSRLNADAVLVRDDLSLLPVAIRWARRTQRIIRQNLAWAIGYNALVLPLAVSGLLSPWMAALGMSASSLIVVLNASRLKTECR